MIHWIPMFFRMHLDAVEPQLANGAVAFLDREIAREPVEGLSAAIEGMRVCSRRLEPRIDGGEPEHPLRVHPLDLRHIVVADVRVPVRSAMTRALVHLKHHLDIDPPPAP